jgi:hypothetical protein
MLNQNKLDKIKEITINALATMLSTYPAYLTVSIKKYSTGEDKKHLITGTYRKREFLDEEVGNFRIELVAENLEIENLEIY